MTSEHTPAQGPITVTTAEGQSPIVINEPQIPVASPIVDGNPPAPAPTPVVEPAPTEPVVPPVVEAAPDAKKYESDALQRRINELTAKRFEAERLARAETERAQKAEQANADLIAKLGGRVDPATGQPVAPQMGEDEIERRAWEKAQQIAEINRFNDVCTNIAESGKKQFMDWDEALQNLTMVGAIGKNVSPEFLQTAVELKEPHKVLHYLGKNFEEAEKITKLPPKRMAMELARVEASLGAPAPAPAPTAVPISNAPAPIITVGGKASPGVPDITDPNTSMDDFMALRYKQLDERKSRYRR